MKDKLSENIRIFRKERGLTQEQLAEVLNVSLAMLRNSFMQFEIAIGYIYRKKSAA